MSKMTLEEKQRLAKTVMNKINKDSGEMIIGFAKDVAKQLTFLELPSEELNAMLGGGIARGRITEIFGNNSSGKTSLMLEAIGEEQEQNPDSIWGWIESEGSFDPDYAEEVHGVDLERLILIDITDEGAEKAIDRLEALMRARILTGFVVNSVAGLVPKVELEEELEKQNIALQARMMSKLMRKWTALINKLDIYAVFINQLRTDINVRFGDPSVTTGGRALAFYASQRFGMNNLKLQDTDPIKADEGMKISARVAKNRCVYDNPYKKCEYYVLYGIGVDKVTEIIDNVGEAGIMRIAGAWYYYEKEDGELLKAPTAIVNGKEQKDVELRFQGKKALRSFIEENEWFFQQLKDELRGKAKRGEFQATTQSEEEMKEIEELNAIEKKIAQEIEKETKEDKNDKKEKKPAKRNMKKKE